MGKAWASFPVAERRLAPAPLAPEVLSKDSCLTCRGRMRRPSAGPAGRTGLVHPVRCKQLSPKAQQHPGRSGRRPRKSTVVNPAGPADAQTRRSGLLLFTQESFPLSHQPPAVEAACTCIRFDILDPGRSEFAPLDKSGGRLMGAVQGRLTLLALVVKTATVGTRQGGEYASLLQAAAGGRDQRRPWSGLRRQRDADLFRLWSRCRPERQWNLNCARRDQRRRRQVRDGVGENVLCGTHGNDSC